MENRYDRQTRLWGLHGQENLNRARVTILGSSILAVEIIKNLILPGVKCISVVDDALVTAKNLGNSFCISQSALGTNRAEAVCQFLQSMNPDVHLRPIFESPEDIPLEKLSRSDVIVAADLRLSLERIIRTSEFCRASNKWFFWAFASGLVGWCRADYAVTPSYNGSVQSRMNIVDMPSSLREWVDSLDFETMPPTDKEAVPFVVLLRKAWLRSLTGIPLIEALASLGVPAGAGNLTEAYNHALYLCAENPNSDWIGVLERSLPRLTLAVTSNGDQAADKALCGLNETILGRFCSQQAAVFEALLWFAKLHKRRPCRAQLADMDCSTEYYQKMLSLYKMQKSSDIDQMREYANEKHPHSEVPDHVWSNAVEHLEGLGVCCSRSLREEFSSSALSENANEFALDEFEPNKGPFFWYCAWRTFQRCTQLDLPCELPVHFKRYAQAFFVEPCEVPSTAAIIGAATAQEITKALANYGVLLNNIWVYE